MHGYGFVSLCVAMCALWVAVDVAKGVHIRQNASSQSSALMRAMFQSQHQQEQEQGSSTTVCSCDDTSCETCIGTGFCGCNWCVGTGQSKPSCMKKRKCAPEFYAFKKKKLCTTKSQLPMPSETEGVSAKRHMEAVSELPFAFLAGAIDTASHAAGLIVKRYGDWEPRDRGFVPATTRECPSCPPVTDKGAGVYYKVEDWAKQVRKLPPNWEVVDNTPLPLIGPALAECKASNGQEDNCEGLHAVAFRLKNTHLKKNVLLVSFRGTMDTQDGIADVAWYGVSFLEKLQSKKMWTPLKDDAELWPAITGFLSRVAVEKGCPSWICTKTLLSGVIKFALWSPSSLLWILRKVLNRDAQMGVYDYEANYANIGRAAFHHAYDTLCTKDEPCTNIVFTGHSLGGAAAQLVAIEVAANQLFKHIPLISVTTGAPGIESVKANWGFADSVKDKRYPFLYNFFHRVDMIPTIDTPVGYSCRYPNVALKCPAANGASRWRQKECKCANERGGSLFGYGELPELLTEIIAAMKSTDPVETSLLEVQTTVAERKGDFAIKRSNAIYLDDEMDHSSDDLGLDFGGRDFRLQRSKPLNLDELPPGLDIGGSAIARDKTLSPNEFQDVLEQPALRPITLEAMRRPASRGSRTKVSAILGEDPDAPVVHKSILQMLQESGTPTEQLIPQITQRFQELFANKYPFGDCFQSFHNNYWSIKAPIDPDNVNSLSCSLNLDLNG